MEPNFNLNQGANHKKRLIIIALVILVIVIIGIITVISVNNMAGSNTQTEADDARVNVDPQNGSGLDVTGQTPEELENRGYKLSILGAELPYKGQNFSLSYDLDNDAFTLYVNPAAAAQGEAEFEAYLKEKGIESPSWIKILNRTTQPF